MKLTATLIYFGCKNELFHHFFFNFLDTEENRLYWINYEGDIKSAKDDGSDIKTIFSTLDQRIFRAIRVIGTNIYYAHNNQLLMISKTPGSTPTVLYFDSGDIHSMFVLNEAGMYLTLQQLTVS